MNLLLWLILSTTDLPPSVTPPVTPSLCTLDTWFGTIPCASTGAITITLGELAILGILGFIIGFVSTIGAVLYRHRYGIWTIVVRRVGVTYREVYRHLQKADVTEFKRKLGGKELTFMVMLERTIWMDSYNRPVLLYEQGTITPLQENQMTAQLRRAVTVQAKQLHLHADNKRPAEPFSIFFGRKGAELVIRAVTGQVKTNVGGIALAVLFGIMALVIGYFLGSAFPYTNYVQQATTTATHTSTSSTSSSVVGVIFPYLFGVVWGLYGNVGNGKGVLSMDLIRQWSKMGLPVFGNLKSIEELGYCPTYKHITCDQFMNLDARPTLEKLGFGNDRHKHALVYINEPYSWGMDSRTPTSTISRAMAKKGLQSRKTRLDILFDTQIPSSIDRRFKFLCKVTILALEPIEDNKGDPVQFRYAYWGRYTQKILTIDRAEAEKLYPMYDSEEQVDVEFTDEYLKSLQDEDDIGANSKRDKPAKEFIQAEDGVRVYGNKLA